MRDGAEPEPVRLGRILIADDDVLVSRPLRKILSARGHTVDCVETGGEAIAALGSARYDVLVTDICMPGNVALDLLNTPEVEGARLPVILITGYPSLETAVSAVKHGVVDYIIKPVQPQALLASVDRALAKKSQAQSASQIGEQLSGVTAALQSVREALSSVGGARTAARDEHEERADPTDDDAIVRERLSSKEFAELSKREREILVFIARGGRAPAIAASLGISPSTVRNHLKSVYRKLGVRSQLALVRKLFR